ncbi:hypothetical protein RchiOBHm_Chr5g0020241 [Rosa chinensis]|uniref:Uncharacterized protein n=1 Tax=Rosa chinensis TaxID=74649 RepID=A0A2P6Q798_ROSCH|nr:hypothetical protein RchiOBHm_Chr5g0020241 [Rosa chinensis]
MFMFQDLVIFGIQASSPFPVAPADVDDENGIRLDPLIELYMIVSLILRFG